MKNNGKENLIILAIETSCDETAVAVVSVGERPEILSNIVSSQVDLHALTGGVVPEVASRAHVEAIIPVIAEALVLAKYSKQEKQNSNKLVNNDLVSDFDTRISDLYSEAQSELKNISHIAYTAGPGLIGSLLVGYNAAKTLAYTLGLPIIPINHIEGHIYSAFVEEISNPPARSSLSDEVARPQSRMTGRAGDKYEKSIDYKQLTINNKQICFPLLALTVSGGHTSLTLMRDHGKYENIGKTLDDAAGEAFDKVAKLLDLGYPGGPAVSKLANEFRNKKQDTRNKVQTEGIKSANQQLTKVQKNNNLTLLRQGYAGRAINQLIKSQVASSKLKDSNPQLQTPNSKLIFPRPILNDGTFNFSFSGLKTAVLQCVLNIKKEHELNDLDKAEIATAFEDAVVDVLTTKTMRAIEKYKVKSVALAGGVAANQQLRKVLQSKIEGFGGDIHLHIPPISLCGDNALMIGLAGNFHLLRGETISWDKADVDSNLELT